MSTRFFCARNALVCPGHDKPNEDCVPAMPLDATVELPKITDEPLPAQQTVLTADDEYWLGQRAELLRSAA